MDIVNDRGAGFCDTATKLPKGDMVTLCVNGSKLTLYDVDMKSNIGELLYAGETGFYYLNSRYYDPVFGRFISPDETDYLGADGSLLSYKDYLINHAEEWLLNLFD